ncbi:MAG: TIM44-like domain-containing protein [Mariprofundaceae bacterium]|nr:TIM44-like domain-containing protein [Mariprofundaceae bacterium]
MKKLLVLSMVAIFTLTMVGVEEADARRFGGGSSFGKSRMFKQPAQQRTPTQKATPASAQRGSAGTGMMGMIGGLALGGLLGAMFFGGAFEGINLFDILIFGALLFVLFKLIGRRAASPMAFAGSRQEQGSGRFGAAAEGSPARGQAVTPDIDRQFFLGAARDIFVRMQAAWDRKDMDEIRGFCMPEVASRIELEMNTLGEKTTRTEVATLDAEITDAWVESNLEWVAVHFTAMIQEQEDGVETATHEVQEHWIFQHDPNSDDPTWYLAGIQQA